MDNREFSTETVSTLFESIDLHLQLSLANAAIGKIPAPRVTPQMIEQAQVLARIAGLDIEFRSVPGENAGRAFAELSHTLFAEAEKVWIEQA